MSSSAARVWITSGLPRLARELDLRRERALLVGSRRGAVAVEVESGLADRHAALVRGERAQLGEVGVVEAPRRVGMAPDRGVDLREGLGRGQRGAAGGAVDADREHAADPRRLRGRDELGVGRLAEVEMGVGVDQAAPAPRGSFGNSASSVSTAEIPPRPSSAPSSEVSSAPSAASSRSLLAGR